MEREMMSVRLRTVVATHALPRHWAVAAALCVRSKKAIMLKRGVTAQHTLHTQCPTVTTHRTTAHTSILCFNTTINALALCSTRCGSQCGIAALCNWSKFRLLTGAASAWPPPPAAGHPSASESASSLGDPMLWLVSPM